MRPAGGNHRTLRRYVEQVWQIPTDHFDPDRARNAALKGGPIPLSLILVDDSSYSRAHLKTRLFKEGLKARVYCSRYCGVRRKGDGAGWPERRRVSRPPYTHLVREVRALGYVGTGRRYGVSDNGIRKWLRQYEREGAHGESQEARSPLE
jgi:hypothetical protein